MSSYVEQLWLMSIHQGNDGKTDGRFQLSV